MTSLTRSAPAASEASATTTFDVSTDMAMSGHRLRISVITGTTRRSSSAKVDRIRARPGRLAADVDDVGAASDEILGVLKGVVKIETAAAVGERIGGAVEDAHDQRLRPWPQPVDTRKALGSVSLAMWCPGRCVLGQLDSYSPIFNSEFLILFHTDSATSLSSRSFCLLISSTSMSECSARMT